MQRRAIAVVGIAVFTASVLAVTAAQESKRTPVAVWQEAVYLPVIPQVGQEINFEKARCTVREVRREWVRCDATPQWRNLYNGHQYTVRDLPAPAP
jgi:hypothetical protein